MRLDGDGRYSLSVMTFLHTIPVVSTVLQLYQYC